MDDEDRDRREHKALFRYQVISAYLALEPPRGQRRALLEQLAAKPWRGPDGEVVRLSAETLRSWVRRYRRGGLAALYDKVRPRRGVQALSPTQVETVLALKREVPARSLDRILEIAEQMKLIEPGVLRRSTLHRVLQRAGLSKRPSAKSSRQDLDRFEAQAPNDLWQSDMLVGPWLPDPQRPGKKRRAYLYLFLDDHSRLLLHGRFSFKGELPALELVLRRCVQKYGRPTRLYYDNGKVYRSGHMRRIAAVLGIHAVVFTQAYRPEGHGKIEALNRLVRAAFLAELAASSVRTLDELNEAFLAWADLRYNRRLHTETQQAPRDRWRAGLERVRYVEPTLLETAFRWSERRTPDKSGLFSLFGTRYQVGPELAKRRVEVLFDPEDLSEVEVHHQGRFHERCRPFQVQTHRRPQPKQAPAPVAVPPTSTTPTADWLEHLVQQRRAEQLRAEPPPPPPEPPDEALLRLLQERLDPRVFDERTAREFLRRYGPLDPQRAAEALSLLLEGEPPDRHLLTVLHDLRKALS